MANVFDDIEDANGNARLLTRTEIKTRLLKLAPKAFQTLELNLYCGDSKVEVQAAAIILDRCGFGPQSKITVDDQREDLSNLSREQLAARAAQVARQLLEQQNDDDTPKHVGPFDTQVH